MTGGQWLRRSTPMPSGWASGGGDTECNKQPQPITLVKVVTGSETASFAIPKGSTVLAGVSFPFLPAEGDTHTAATTGDVKVGVSGSLDRFQPLSPGEDYVRTAFSTGDQRTSETRVYVTAVALDGYVKAGIEVLLPTIRA